MKHYVGICLVLITVAAIGLFVVHSIIESTERGVHGALSEIRDAFGQVLNVQPRVTVNQRVILTQTAPIAELAVVTKEELVEIGSNAHLELLSVQIPLTEKTLTVQSTYRLKAGFDLREPFSVEIDPATHQLHATMPHAKILSVEQVGDLVYHGEDAALNRITDEERSQLLSDLNAAARDAAEKSGLKQDAEKQVAARLKEIMEHNGQALEIRWNDESLKPRTP